MCTNVLCLKKDTCYRFLAKPDRYQSYLIIPTDVIDGCAEYWEVNDNDMSARKDG